MVGERKKEGACGGKERGRWVRRLADKQRGLPSARESHEKRWRKCSEPTSWCAHARGGAREDAAAEDGVDVAGEQLLRATLGDEEGYGADDNLTLGLR